jgi:TctA family transporter
MKGRMVRNGARAVRQKAVVGRKTAKTGQAGNAAWQAALLLIFNGLLNIAILVFTDGNIANRYLHFSHG